MKWIVLSLLLISNICYSQDILLPKKVVEFYMEKADLADSLIIISKEKDKIINKQDKEVKLANTEIEMWRFVSETKNSIIAKKDTTIMNKDKEIVLIEKQNRRTIRGLIGGLSIETLILLILLL